MAEIRKRWTTADVEKLKELYVNPNNSIEYIAKYFGRSRQCIVIKASRSGLGMERTSRVTWTKEDDELLEKLYKDTNCSNNDIIENLERSWSAITRRASTLGIPRRDWLDEDRLMSDLTNIVIPNNNNEFPTPTDVQTKDFGLNYDLIGAINRHGGAPFIKEKLGMRKEYTIGAYLKAWNRFEEYLRQHFGDLISQGICPTAKQICLTTDISESLIHKHGGIIKIAKKLNCLLSSKYWCRDGHYADSLYELVVDEYLFSRNIEHESHPYIGLDKCQSDFKLKNFYIEVWGFPSDAKGSKALTYNEKRKKKTNYYETNNFKLINIDQSVFGCLYSKKGLTITEENLNQLFESYNLPTHPIRPFDNSIFLCDNLFGQRRKTALKGRI